MNTTSITKQSDSRITQEMVNDLLSRLNDTIQENHIVRKSLEKLNFEMNDVNFGKQ